MRTPTGDQPRHLKSVPPLPTGTGHAEPAAAPNQGGAPRSVGRKPVLTVVRTDPRPPTLPGPSEDPTPDKPGIRIYAPPIYRDHTDGARWSMRHATTPTAAWACACGQMDTARGRNAVALLADQYSQHKRACTAQAQGRNAP